jgi:hypothetical protein
LNEKNTKLSAAQLELLTRAAQNENHSGYASQQRQLDALVQQRLAVSLGPKVWLRGFPFRLTSEGLTVAASHRANQSMQEKP